MKTRNYFILAAVAMMTAACSSDDQRNDGPVAAQISAGVSGPATRAMNDTWEADEIGVTVTDAPVSEMATMYRNVKYSTEATTNGAANFSSQTPICFRDAEEMVTFSAYGPYQAQLGEDGAIAANTADQSTREKQKAFDFIFASGAKASKSNPTVEFKKVSDDESHAFTHNMTRMVIIVKPGDLVTLDEIKKAAITVGGLKHEGTFNAMTGVAAASGDAVADWTLSANALRSEGDDNVTFTSILLPQTLAAALTFTATIDGVDYTNKDAINPKLEASKTYTYTITVKKTGLEVSGCTIENWSDGGSGSGDAVLQ